MRVCRYNLLTHIGYTSTFGDRKQRKDAGCSDVLKVRSNYPEESFQHKCCSAYPYSPCAETFVCGSGKWHLSCSNNAKKECKSPRKQLSREVQIRYVSEKHRPRKASTAGHSRGSNEEFVECTHSYEGPQLGYLSGYPEGSRKAGKNIKQAMTMCDQSLTELLLLSIHCHPSSPVLRV